MKKLKETGLALFERFLRVGRKFIALEESIPSSIKVGALLILLLGSLGLAIWYASGHSVVVLEPRGVIAHEQRKLIFTALLMSLVVVVPVYAMALFFYRTYRSDNNKASYKPEWHGSRWLETIWWGVPVVLIIVLSVLTWQSSHSLDPFKSIAGAKKTLTIQVVALEWKWLFIYPDQGVATVNEAYIPVDTEVDFEITADAPMSSFWVPQLGGQVYAMSGMTTHLHEMATSEGVYNGANANIAGVGHSGMVFTLHAVKDDAFKDWVSRVRKSDNVLTHAEYTDLAKPTESNPPSAYVLHAEGLFHHIVMDYMSPFAEGDTH